MRKLRIGIIGLVAKGPTRAWFARVMHANLANIMPQVIAAMRDWYRNDHHDWKRLARCSRRTHL